MRRFLAGLTGVAILTLPSSAQDAPKPRPAFTGVNLAGAEFGKPGGAHGTDYKYPAAAEIDDIAQRGFTIIRVPFLWEHLQPDLSGDFAPDELKRLDAVVARARAKKLAVILDPHNYARRGDAVIGTDTLPNAAFADFWRRLAEHYRGRDGVIFGLMNEPHDMRTETWADAAQAALDAIRATGACNRVLAPGNDWTGAHSWSSGSYGTPNAVAMANLRDPLGRTTFEFHQYLDADWSGRAKTCEPPEKVVAALAVATQWLEAKGATGFLGEIGAGADPQCLAGLDAMLAHFDAKPKVWRGWTAWAAGAWWPADYPLLLRRVGEADTPQLAVFTKWRAPADRTFAAASCKARPGRAPR